MSYEVTPYSGSELPQRQSRRATRAISRHRSAAVVRISASDADIDVAQAKLDGLTVLTGHAMSCVGRVFQALRHLEQLAPEASGHLTLLTEDHLLSMRDVLADARRNLRQR